jgi:hypothetical protein
MLDGRSSAADRGLRAHGLQGIGVITLRRLAVFAGSCEGLRTPSRRPDWGASSRGLRSPGHLPKSFEDGRGDAGLAGTHGETWEARHDSRSRWKIHVRQALNVLRLGGMSGFNSQCARMRGAFSEGCCVCMVFKEMALWGFRSAWVLVRIVHCLVHQHNQCSV